MNIFLYFVFLMLAAVDCGGQHPIVFDYETRVELWLIQQDLRFEIGKNDVITDKNAVECTNFTDLGIHYVVEHIYGARLYEQFFLISQEPVLMNTQDPGNFNQKLKNAFEVLERELYRFRINFFGEQYVFLKKLFQKHSFEEAFQMYEECTLSIRTKIHQFLKRLNPNIKMYEFPVPEIYQKKYSWWNFF